MLFRSYDNPCGGTSLEFIISCTFSSENISPLSGCVYVIGSGANRKVVIIGGELSTGVELLVGATGSVGGVSGGITGSLLVELVSVPSPDNCPIALCIVGMDATETNIPTINNVNIRSPFILPPRTHSPSSLPKGRTI